MIQAKRGRVKLKLLALGVGIYLTWTLGKGVLELRLAYRRIDEARQILTTEQVRGEELKRKWAEIQTPEYLEKVARNDLNMQKEGETVAVLVGDARQSPESKIQNPESDKEVPNWQKWLSLVR